MVINTQYEQRVIHVLRYLKAPYPTHCELRANLRHVIYKSFFNFGFSQFLGD